MAATRPKSIAWFERLYPGSLAIAAAMIATAWEMIRSGVIPYVLRNLAAA